MALAAASRISGAHSRPEAAGWEPHTSSIVIGKDILELLSSAMYIDPMTIFREYVQNAADAVDEARRTNVLSLSQVGQVEISLDSTSRSIRMRDNGTGIPEKSFTRTLTAFGASSKRGAGARGFRGVGRLSGLGYCQELVFRSRANGEAWVSELRWDCRRLKAALRSSEFSTDLAGLVGEAVTSRRVKPDPSSPPHFFEVELRGVTRHRGERLLSPEAVGNYLAQVAPVPFSSDFEFGREIEAALKPHVALGNLEIRIDGAKNRIERPHLNRLEISEGKYDQFTDLEILQIPSMDGGIAAVGWVLHHGYHGAIPAAANVKGLRLRSGNMQVGDHTLLEPHFPESRFNSWAVGEIHIVAHDIVPNGRRDHFEQNVHFANLTGHLAPMTRDISRRCRTSSIKRKWLRDFDLHAEAVRERTAIIRQGALAKRERVKIAGDATRALASMEKISKMEALESETRLARTVTRLRAKLDSALGQDEAPLPLARLTSAQRKTFEQVFGLIYQCSNNRTVAKVLVDRILLALA